MCEAKRETGEDDHTDLDTCGAWTPGRRWAALGLSGGFPKFLKLTKRPVGMVSQLGSVERDMSHSLSDRLEASMKESSSGEENSES